MRPRNRKKTPEQYEEELKVKNSKIVAIEKYSGASTKILHKCLIHDYIWSVIPSNVLKGCGCPQCRIDRVIETSKRTHDEYVELLEVKNKNIEVLEDYMGCDTPIKHRCLICDNIWNVSPRNIVNENHGCPICAKVRNNEQLKRTPDEYVELVKEANSDIEVLDIYSDSQTPIFHRCKICGHIWNAIPNNILRGHGCKSCATKLLADKSRKSTDDFIKEMSHINSNIVIIGEYCGAKSPIECQCKVCGYIWNTATPTALLTHKSGCPNCHLFSGERIISQILDECNIGYKSQKKYNDLRGINGGILSYDFYLPQYNLLIEFQGKQHDQVIEYFGGEKQFQNQQEHDKRKREYAKQNNINLLEIWYYDINNIESILLQKISELDKNNLKSKSVETAGCA